MSASSPESAPDYIESIFQEIPEAKFLEVILATYNICEYLLGKFKGNKNIIPGELDSIKNHIPNGDASSVMDWAGINITDEYPKLAQAGDTAGVEKLYQFVQILTDQHAREIGA